MVGCSILRCKSYSENQTPKLSFHAFPTELVIKDKWIKATGRSGWQPNKYSKVCSIHFEKSDCIFKSKRKYLKPHAIPKLHIPGDFETVEPTSHYQSAIIDSKSGDLGKIERNSPYLGKVPMPVACQKRECADKENVEPKRPRLGDFETVEPTSHYRSATIDSKSGDLGKIERNSPYLKEKMSKIRKFAETGNHGIRDLKNSPQVNELICKYEKLKILSEKRLKKLRAVRESRRRLIKKVANLENILAELKCKMLINSEETEVLRSIETGNKDFLKRFVNKNNCSKEYSESLRKFALSLHFISPKAYSFVRKTFDTCLPHPKTLHKWYTCINCEPGFTKESFDAIRTLVKNSSEKVVCAVSLDEMSIRTHLQWNGEKIVGYVDIGQNLDTDTLAIAKDALVFMVTAVNKSWKLPVGYFLTNGVKGDQRSELLKTLIHLLTELIMSPLLGRRPTLLMQVIGHSALRLAKCGLVY